MENRPPREATMTFLGKLFVMVNVAISLGMAFLAVGLYFNGVDWGYDVAKPGTMGGVIKERQDQVKEFQAVQGSSESAWKVSRAALWKAEQERLEAKAFYAAQLKHNREAAKPDDKNAARAVEQVTFRPVGQKDKPHLPSMKPARVRGDKDKEAELPYLGSRAWYQAEIANKQKINLSLLDDLSKQFEEDVRLTKLIYDK